MKKYFPMIIPTLILALTACQAIPSTSINQPSTQPVMTSTETAPAVDTKPASTMVVYPSATSSPTVTLTPTPAVTPRPKILINLRRYDFDVNPPIDVLHNPPVIVRMDETVNLEFSFVCKYPPLGPKCPPLSLFTFLMAKGMISHRWRLQKKTTIAYAFSQPIFQPVMKAGSRCDATISR